MAVRGVYPVVIATITALTTATAISATSIPCGAVYFEADEGNSGKLYIGDSAVSATNYMAVISVTATATAAGNTLRGFWVQAPHLMGPGASNLDLKGFYVIGGAASQKLHVTYFERMGG